MPTFTIKGRDILIDMVDIPLLNSHSWWWTPQGYLVTKSTLRGKFRTVCFHRLALGDPDSQAIDHINRDKSDNRRINLRPCSYRQNNLNKPLPERGVTFHKKRGKWQVVVRDNGKLKWLGYFDTQDDALECSKSFYDGYTRDPFV